MISADIGALVCGALSAFIIGMGAGFLLSAVTMRQAIADIAAQFSEKD